MSDMSIMENINAGKYQNQVPFPREKFPNKEAHYEALKGYRAGEHTARELFKKDLFEAYGLEGHPKAERLYEIAWSHGHSSGYYEVLNWFDELSELLE